MTFSIYRFCLTIATFVYGTVDESYLSNKKEELKEFNGICNDEDIKTSSCVKSELCNRTSFTNTFIGQENNEATEIITKKDRTQEEYIDLLDDWSKSLKKQEKKYLKVLKRIINYKLVSPVTEKFISKLSAKFEWTCQEFNLSCDLFFNYKELMCIAFKSAYKLLWTNRDPLTVVHRQIKLFDSYLKLFDAYSDIFSEIRGYALHARDDALFKRSTEALEELQFLKHQPIGHLRALANMERMCLTFKSIE